LCANKHYHSWQSFSSAFTLVGKHQRMGIDKSEAIFSGFGNPAKPSWELLNIPKSS
jgi:hypothetical protein